MDITRRATGWIFLFAFTAFLLPQSLFAAGAGISDAALQNGGTLHGQLVDQEGLPQKGVDVVLRHDLRVVAVTKTDSLGRFAITGLRAGVYQVVTTRGSHVYRLWAPKTAPPAAQQRILLVTASEIVRGQIDMDRYGPAIRGAVAGGLITGLTYWAIDHNPEGS